MKSFYSHLLSLAVLASIAAVLIWHTPESTTSLDQSTLHNTRSDVRPPISYKAKPAKKASRFMSERKKRVKGATRKDQPNLFAQLHNHIRTRTGEAAPAYPPNYRIQELLKARGVYSTAALSKTGTTTLPWEERGPGNVAGRARGLVVDPDDPSLNTWFIGSASGGIWKTTDAGQTWINLTGNLPNLATTTLALSPANPNIIYAGTGEAFGDFAFVNGDGVWKSTDKGETWQQLESTASNPRFTNVSRLIVDPADPNVVVASTSSTLRSGDGTLTSSIFRSVDGGSTWTETFTTDRRIDQVIANPQNFNTQLAVVNNSHVIKSLDSGQTWFSSSNGLDGVEGRMEMAMAPSDTNKVYISAEGGETGSVLFASFDSGTTWAATGDIDGNDVDWLGGQGFYDNTIAVHPENPDRIYVGGINIIQLDLQQGTTSVRAVTGVDQENTESFLQLIPIDGVTDGVEEASRLAAFASAETEISSEDLRTVEIRFGTNVTQQAHRFTASNFFPPDQYEDYVEVPFEVWDLTTNEQLMVAFVDQDGDGAWLPVFEEIFVLDIPYNADTPDTRTTANIFIRGLYMVLVALPDTVFDAPNPFPTSLLRINVDSRTLTGITTSPVTDGYGELGGDPKGVHVDHHNIVFAQHTHGTYRLLNANDGGIAFSDDEGDTFTQTGDTFLNEGSTSPTLRGLNTSQFYGVDKMNGGDRYVGGTQDNGSWVSATNPDATSQWVSAPSGDGFEAAWHYRNSNLVLESSQFNNILRSEDGGASWQQVDLNPDEFGNGPFLTRIASSKQNPDLVFGISTRGVLRSEDFGASWTLIEMTDGWSASAGFFDTSIEISLASPDVVWAGGGLSSDSPLFVSQDAGLSFEAASPFAGASLGPLTGIATHPTDANTAYALFSQPAGPKVLQTTDLGQTWTELSGFGTSAESSNGYPDVATYSLLVMPFDTNQIWAGTEIGLFASADGGATWAYADNGFPAVGVWEMKIVNDEVVLATHGRGVWSVTLPELAGYEPPAFTLAPLLSNVSGGLGGEVRLTVGRRSAYDSTTVFVDGNRTLALGANTAPVDTSLTLLVSVTAPRTATIAVESYIGATVLRSRDVSIDVLPAQQAQVRYTTDFEAAAADFQLTNMAIQTEAGFPDGALHSLHPYQPGQSATALLTVPIIVADQNATLTYRDIAIVEPGEGGSLFGSAEFYDFVVVEGSADNGVTWEALAPGYDIRFDPTWLSVNPEEAPDPSLFRDHTINLLDTFSAGDQILVRFRLFADGSVQGWGWVVDDLVVQGDASGVSNEQVEVPTAFELAQNYPNPFNPSTTISYTLHETSDVRLSIYNVNGQHIKTLVTQPSQAKGTYRVTWDGTSDAGVSVASGMYLYRLETPHATQHKQMILLK